MIVKVFTTATVLVEAEVDIENQQDFNFMTDDVKISDVKVSGAIGLVGLDPREIEELRKLPSTFTEDVVNAVTLAGLEITLAKGVAVMKKDNRVTRTPIPPINNGDLQ